MPPAQLFKALANIAILIKGLDGVPSDKLPLLPPLGNVDMDFDIDIIRIGLDSIYPPIINIDKGIGDVFRGLPSFSILLALLVLPALDNPAYTNASKPSVNPAT